MEQHASSMCFISVLVATLLLLILLTQELCEFMCEKSRVCVADFYGLIPALFSSIIFFQPFSGIINLLLAALSSLSRRFSFHRVSPSHFINYKHFVVLVGSVKLCVVL